MLPNRIFLLFIVVPALLFFGLGRSEAKGLVWHGAAGLGGISIPSGNMEWAEGRSAPVMGFSETAPVGFNANLIARYGLNRALHMGGVVGYASFAESKNGATHILNIYSLAPQFHFQQRVLGAWKAIAEAGAGTYLLHDKLMDRDDAMDDNWSIGTGLRYGFGVARGRMSLRLSQQMLQPARAQDVVHLTEVNFGFDFAK